LTSAIGKTASELASALLIRLCLSQPAMSQKARADGVPPPSPQGIALAKFLRYNAALKNRVGSLNGKRVEFFKGPKLPP